MSAPRVPVKYTVDDQELLLDFYKKALWNRIVPRIPDGIAPNAITIVGQIAAILAVVTAGLGVAGSPIFYVISAFLLLTYLTCDNVDGAHARRTGQTSPLGEFLDHGLDGVASGAVIIIAAMVLRIDALPMVLLCGLAAVGFVLVFWEQFRTGHLVIPKVSSTEGVTLLMFIQMFLAIAGDPTWMHFTMETITAGTVIVMVVIVGYAAAMAPPMWRVGQRGGNVWETLPIVGLALAPLGFVAAGASPLLPAIAVGIFGADVVCRMIVLRHRGQTGPIIGAWQVAPLVPVVPALALPEAWAANGWAAVSLALMALAYAVTLYRGGSELLNRCDEGTPHAAEA